jgi:hypothetical protein
MNPKRMKAVRFEELPGDALFWISGAEQPREPHEFFGPYKKRIYLEFRPEPPGTVFVRPETAFEQTERPEAR